LRRNRPSDAARPATATERKILDAAAAAGNDPQHFAAALAQDGIALARVTVADVAALDERRKDEMLTAAVDAGYQPRFIPMVEAGQLVAVDHHGGIHQLNPHHVEEMNRRLERGDSEVAETSGERTTAHPNATENYKDAGFGRIEPLPSVEAVRSGFEIAAREAVSFQQSMIDIQLDRRAEQADARMLAFANRQAEAADRATDRALNSAAESAARGVDGVLSGVEKVATAVFEAVAAPLEGIANLHITRGDDIDRARDDDRGRERER
jgi:hypothetical protein